MTEILYESELFNGNSHAMFPFKIMIEREIQSLSDFTAVTVTVYRVEYQSVGNRTIPNKKILNTSFWKNS